MTKLKDLFNISYGNQLDLNKLEVLDNKYEEGINFISRSSSNLGVVCKVKYVFGKTPFKKGSITVTLGGEYLLSAYLQKDDFYTSQNIKVLTPKQSMSDIEKIFYCYVIQSNRFRYYSHGREANKTLDDLKIPSIREIPSWIYSAKIVKLKKEAIVSKKYELNVKDWKWIKVSDLFEVCGTKHIITENISEYEKGNHPFVVTSSRNNGIEGFYNYYTEEGNVLTIDSATVGTCFYQKLNFSASDHVEKLIPKFNLNMYSALFLTTIINLEQKRYGYGRKFSQKRIKETKIKLPVDNKGGPDWQFMEDYIKSLPYSSNL